MRDDVVLTPQSSLTDVFLSISKLKKYFNDEQLTFLQSLNGNQFIEIVILIVLHILRRSGQPISNSNVEKWLVSKSLSALTKHMIKEMTISVHEVQLPITLSINVMNLYELSFENVVKAFNNTDVCSFSEKISLKRKHSELL